MELYRNNPTTIKTLEVDRVLTHDSSLLFDEIIVTVIINDSKYSCSNRLEEFIVSECIFVHIDDTVDKQNCLLVTYASGSRTFDVCGSRT